MALNPNAFVDGAINGFSLHIEPPSYTGLGRGKVLFKSSMTDLEAKYMFNISFLSSSFSANILLHLKGGSLVEILPLSNVCFEVFQNVLELQSSEERSLSSLFEFS